MIFLTVVACEIGRNSYFAGTDQRTGSGVWWELWVICCINSDLLEIWISLGSAFFAYFLFCKLCRLQSALQILLRSRNNASSMKTSAMSKRYIRLKLEQLETPGKPWVADHRQTGEAPQQAWRHPNNHLKGIFRPWRFRISETFSRHLLCMRKEWTLER